MKLSICRYAALLTLLAASVATAQDKPADGPPAAGQPTPARPGPRISLSQTKWDFGEVWHLDQPKMDLIVKNEGTETLKLVRVHTSCGCTAAQPDKKELAAGESTKVHVVFNSKGKQGKVTSKVLVYSNDPGKPQVSMDIEGVVKRAVVVDPIGGLFVRTLETNGTYTTKCRVKNNEAEPMKLEVKQSTAPGWTFQINEITAGVEYEIVASLQGPVPAGMTKGQLVLSTGVKREPQLTIPVKITVMSRVELIPRAFMFMKEDTDPANRTINVEYYGDGDFQVLSATSSLPAVGVQVRPARGGTKGSPNIPSPKRVVPIALTIPPGNELPPDGAVITITTNDPDYGVLEVILTTDSDTYQSLQHDDGPTPQKKGGAAAPAPATK